MSTTAATLARWPHRTARERFMDHVRISNGCWEWIGYRDNNGYGRFHLSSDEPSIGAHRLSYELHAGRIPEGMQLDHLCRVRHCVNPAHLEVVTQRENILRGISPAARQAGQTHCHRGHEFTPENTHVTRQGKRDCRACAREDARLWRSENRDLARTRDAEKYRRQRARGVR